MHEWPAALQQGRLLATSRGVELHFRERGGSSARFLLAPRSVQGHATLIFSELSNDFAGTRGQRLSAALARAVTSLPPAAIDFVHRASRFLRAVAAQLSEDANEASATHESDALELPPWALAFIESLQILRGGDQKPSASQLDALANPSLRLGVALALDADEPSFASADQVLADPESDPTARTLAHILRGREGSAREVLVDPVQARRFDQDARYQLAVHLHDWHTAYQTRRDRVGHSRRPGELIAITHHALDAGELADAGDIALRVLELDPDDDATFVDAGELGVRAGRIDAVLGHCERRMGERPSLAIALAGARFNLWRDRLGEAQTWLERAEFDEQDVNALRTRAGIAIRAGRYADARPDLERALELSPRDRETTIWLGESYLRAGLDAEGVEVLERFNKKVCGEHPIGKVLQAIGNQASYSEHPSANGSTAYIYRFIGRDALGRAVTDFRPAAQRKYMLDVVDAFGGNRSDTLTLCREGHLVDAPQVEDPRVRIVRAQHSLRYSSIPAAIAALDELALAHPEVPYPQTYAAELRLWAGDYSGAEREFRDCWDRTTQRWGYVGLGAALHLLGRHEEAIEILRIGPLSKSGEIAGEATPVYRGEALVALGQLEAGTKEVLRATELRPSRIGAWGALAMAHRARGDLEAARIAARRYFAEAPILCWEAQRKMGLPPTLSVDDDACLEIAATALAMQRGNRSSYLLTFFDKDERLRVIETTGRKERLIRLARRCVPSLVMAALPRIVEALGNQRPPA